MSMFDQDNFSEGEWEDTGGLLWNEYDWQKFLKQNEQEIARFLMLYIKLQFKPGHLDEIAHKLGWDKEDWFQQDNVNDESDPWEGFYRSSEEKDSSNDAAPFTIHRHPVYIVTRGITHHLVKSWEYLLEKNPKIASPSATWRLLRILQAAEFNALMAIHSIDFGEYNLCICHLKNALSALNRVFTEVQEILGQEGVSIPQPFVESTRTALFDLRETWLRVIQECRSFNLG